MSMLKFFQFVYGAFMGTTTEYLKSNRKSYEKIRIQEWTKNISLFYGGSGNQLSYQTDEYVYLFDVGLKKLVPLPDKKIVIFLTGPSHHRIATVDLYNADRVFAPDALAEKLKVQTYSEAYELPEIASLFHFHKFYNSHSDCDIAIEIKAEKLIFTGELMYHQVHPELRYDLGLDLNGWVQSLKEIKQKFNDWHFLPGEGELCDINAVEDFIEYLQCLKNPEIDFSYMRKNFDWAEVEGYTSLEENFDLIRNVGPGVRR